MMASCAVCGSVLRPWFERLHRAVFKCRGCGHIQVPAGVVRLSDGGSIYDAQDADIFEGQGNVDYYLDEAAARAARDKLAFVRRYVQGRVTLLDVGANYGQFLAAAHSTFDAFGIEPNPTAVASSRRTLHVRNFVASVYSIPFEVPKPLEVVTAWDVIEHLEDPRRALAACRDHLKKGGWLFLSTPDAGSLPARVLGRWWHYQDPVQHINLFSRRNLERLLGESAFQVCAHTYLGRSYRINYVLHRLYYLMGEHPGRGVVSLALRTPKAVRDLQVTIKLGDVVAVAAQAV